MNILLLKRTFPRKNQEQLFAANTKFDERDHLGKQKRTCRRSVCFVICCLSFLSSLSPHHRPTDPPPPLASQVDHIDNFGKSVTQTKTRALAARSSSLFSLITKQEKQSFSLRLFQCCWSHIMSAARVARLTRACLVCKTGSKKKNSPCQIDQKSGGKPFSLPKPHKNSPDSFFKTSCPWIFPRWRIEDSDKRSKNHGRH